MASSLRCRVAGHDPDECGVCRRCGDDRQTGHDWQAAERREPCFRLEVCQRCAAERKKPDHAWEADPATGLMTCSRCKLAI